MAPAAGAGHVRLPAAVAAVQACIAENYRRGEEGRAAVLACIRELAKADGAPLGDDAVEMAFRQVLAGIMAQALNASEDILDEARFGVRALVDLALGLAQTPPAADGFDCPGKRAPFSLLEDLFDVLGVGQIEACWPYVEEREAALYGIFGKVGRSKLVMLKICNSLLRKLSKSHNTAICGRIMMYLSRNWDLSEASAINKGGAANVANRTVYEDSEEFDRQQERLAEKRRREEELRAAVAGQEKALLAGRGGEDAAPIDYALYQTFWGLQEHLGEPSKVAQSDDAWAAFVAAAKTVLQAFEGFTVSEESATAQAQQAAAAAASAAAASVANGGDKLKRSASSASLGEGGSVATKEGDGEQDHQQQEGGVGDDNEERPSPPQEEEEGDEEEEGSSSRPSPSKKRARSADGADAAEEAAGAYLGCKYLTNSRLFRLQLHDPLVRVQVLTQVLILLNYVHASTALAAEASAAAAPGTPKAAPEPASATSGGSSKPGASELTKHARRLIRATPPHGAAYLASLDTVLDREKAWLAWKQVGKCQPPIERPREQGGPKAVRAQEAVRKALAEAERPATVVAQQRRAFYDKPCPLPRPVHLEAIKKEVKEAAGGATFESYVLPRVEEANDPENCIDEEYHPRHEPVFCWRALRLACSTNPRAVVDLETGSLDTVYTRVTGIVPPDPAALKQARDAQEEAEAEAEAMQQDEVNGSRNGAAAEEEAPAPAMEVDAPAAAAAVAAASE